MGLRKWKLEFYPVEADATQKSEALAHSMRKWRGLTPVNLDKHKVQCGQFGYIESIKNMNKDFAIDADSCALCYHHYRDGACGDCPLYVSRGHVKCDKTTINETISPYAKWTIDNDPYPMIAALEKAENEIA